MGSQALIEIEFDEIAEPKALLSADLLRLLECLKLSFVKTVLTGAHPDFSKNQDVFGVRKPVRTYSF